MLNIFVRYLLPILRSAGSAALTPLLEKKVVKTFATGSPLVVSMSRLIAMAFAIVTLREYWLSGIDGWYDAAVGIATVMALPAMNALERATPDDVIAVLRMVQQHLGRTGPSKFDDHRMD